MHNYAQVAMSVCVFKRLQTLTFDGQFDLCLNHTNNRDTFVIMVFGCAAELHRAELRDMIRCIPPPHEPTGLSCSADIPKVLGAAQSRAELISLSWRWTPRGKRSGAGR